MRSLQAWRHRAASAWLSLCLCAGCDVRSVMFCRSDSDCVASAVCVEGLCFSKDALDGGRPFSDDCDAGEAVGCTDTLGQICLVGRRSCDGGTWGTCVASGPSADVQSCGPSCGPCGPSADRCEQGACRCGAAGPCAPGLRCAPAGCVCDALSCQGCCAGSTCTSIGFPVCSAPGGACTTCDASLADRCSAFGDCQCGLGPPCSVGQRCAQGACVCDALSCAQGCCDGLICRPSSLLSCGTEGQSCVACDPLRADACLANGTCACGPGPQCSAGQQCIKGLCICTSCLQGASLLRQADQLTAAPGCR